MRMNAKGILSLVLSALMISPVPMSAATPAAALGSISSYGSVSVGSVAAPSDGTVFAGDVVKTPSGSASIQYNNGPQVLLARKSSAQFLPNLVRLDEGQMIFRAPSVGAVAFSASSLRLEPSAPGTAANVAFNDGKATVAVSEGSINVIDPSGVGLATVAAGETKLFALAASTAAAPSAAAAPQASGGSSRMAWIIAGAVVAGVTVTAIKLSSDDTDLEELARELQALLAIPASQRTAAQNARIAELQRLLAAGGIPVSP